MKANYIYHGIRYSFVWLEKSYRDQLIIVKDPGTEKEKVYFVLCKHADGVAIRINKKSISADCAAYGAIKFVKRAIDNNLATCFIDKIIETFTA